MTDDEWRADLVTALEGTDWVVESATVTQVYPYAVAALRHRQTDKMKIIQLPLETLRTPEKRAEAIRRELAETYPGSEQ